MDGSYGVCMDDESLLVKQTLSKGLSYDEVLCRYRGAVDAFTFLSHKIVPGTVIVFDDLVRDTCTVALPHV